MTNKKKNLHIMKQFKYFLLTKSVGFYINCLVFINPKKASQLAYSLFSEPRAGKLDPSQLPEMLEVAEKEVFFDGEHKIQTYIWKGNNHKILLVHGWESNSWRWEKFLLHLKKTGSTILAIDAPAHGLSSGKEFTVPKYTKTIAEFVKLHNPNILIGHSIGGAACIYYQYLHQNKNIDKMILLGAPSDLKNLIINYCDMLSLNSKLQFHLEHTFAERFSKQVIDFSAKKFAKEIDTKALIVHDIHDTVVDLSEAEKIIINWKNATFIKTENLGHSLHNDDLYQKMINFLFNQD